jgi:hypothetical protein
MGVGKDKAGRWERPAFLNQPAWGVVEALGVREEASTNGLGTVGGQCGYALHNMRDVLRDVQCRISNLTPVANCWEVSAVGIQKQISREC